MKATKAVSVLLLASICWDDHGTAGVDAESTTTASSGLSQKTNPSNYNGFPLQTSVVVDRNYTNPGWTGQQAAGYGWSTLPKHSCQHNPVVGGTTYSSSDAAEAACEKTDGCMAVENPYCLSTTAPMVPIYVLCLSPRFEVNPGSCLRINGNAQRLYFYDRTAANCGSQDSAYILDWGECAHAFSLLSDQSRPAKQVVPGLVCKDDADSSCGSKVQQSGCFYNEESFKKELTETEMSAAFTDRGLWFKPLINIDDVKVSANVKLYETAPGSGSLCRFRPMEDIEEFTVTSTSIAVTSTSIYTTTTTTSKPTKCPHALPSLCGHAAGCEWNTEKEQCLPTARSKHGVPEGFKTQTSASTSTSASTLTPAIPCQKYTDAYSCWHGKDDETCLWDADGEACKRIFSSCFSVMVNKSDWCIDQCSCKGAGHPWSHVCHGGDAIAGQCDALCTGCDKNVYSVDSGISTTDVDPTYHVLRSTMLGLTSGWVTKEEEECYTMIAAGSCADGGGSPIVTQADCGAAAFNVGLFDETLYIGMSECSSATAADRTACVNIGTDSNRPEGCYYRQEKLWFNSNADNAGIGVVGDRQQLCSQTNCQTTQTTTTGAPEFTTATNPNTGHAAEGRGGSISFTTRSNTPNRKYFSLAYCAGRCDATSGCVAFQYDTSGAECTGIQSDVATGIVLVQFHGIPSPLSYYSKDVSRFDTYLSTAHALPTAIAECSDTPTKAMLADGKSCQLYKEEGVCESFPASFLPCVKTCGNCNSAMASTASTSTTSTNTDLGGIHPPHHPKPRPNKAQTSTTTTTTTHRPTDTSATTKTATTIATTNATTTTTITTTTKTKTQTTRTTRTTQTTLTATKATTNATTTSTTARGTTGSSSSSSSRSRSRTRTHTSSTATYTSRTTASTTATTPASYKTEVEIKDMYEFAAILITIAVLVMGLVYIGKRKLRWFKTNKQKEKRRRSKKRRRRGDDAVNMTNVFTFESDSGSDIGLMGLSNGEDGDDDEDEDGYDYNPSMMNVPLTASSSLSSTLVRSNIGAPIDDAMLEFPPASPSFRSTISNKRKNIPNTNESHQEANESQL